MLELTKTQIAGIIKALKDPCISDREVLKAIRLINGCYYVCNGYMAVKMPTASKPHHCEYKDLEISLESLIKWHKLAKSRAELNEISLLDGELASITDAQYPTVEMFFKEPYDNYTGNSCVKLNASILNIAQQISGSSFIKIYRIEETRYLVKNDDNNIEIIVMGVK